jgi:hypothetical protein
LLTAGFWWYTGIFDTGASLFFPFAGMCFVLVWFVLFHDMRHSTILGQISPLRPFPLSFIGLMPHLTFWEILFAYES